jgi:hypothetical protein
LLPKHVDWRDRKGVFIKDQGNALIPKHVDRRERGVVIPIKDQANSGRK